MSDPFIEEIYCSKDCGVRSLGKVWIERGVCRINEKLRTTEYIDRIANFLVRPPMINEVMLRTSPACTLLVWPLNLSANIKNMGEKRAPSQTKSLQTR